MLLDFVRIDPPGTQCQNQAFFELIAKCKAKDFLEVGCGAGDLSYRLCQKGLRGRGVDSSLPAIQKAEIRLRTYIEKKEYELFHGDFSQMDWPHYQTDVVFSLMVMEHVADDVGFIFKMSRLVRSGGHLIIGVPGRMDKWAIEDDTVGHLRRYERSDLGLLLERTGLKDVEVWSVSVPVANLCFSLGNFFIKRSGEERKLGESSSKQTETSGIREIPFKTTFPKAFRIILNQVTLYPLFLLQRLFYRSDLGLTLLAYGRVT